MDQTHPSPAARLPPGAWCIGYWHWPLCHSEPDVHICDAHRCAPKLLYPTPVTIRGHYDRITASAGCFLSQYHYRPCCPHGRII